MKQFYLCKLCLIVFGALLAVQSAFAQSDFKSPFQIEEELREKISRPASINHFSGGSCFVEKFNLTLEPLAVGKTAPVFGVCESEKAAVYFLRQMKVISKC